jgi:tRNA (guanine-N7-)-methyltransferase
MLVNYNELKIHFASDDLYNSDYNDDILDIKTFYEQQFLDEGLPITYLKFGLDNSKEIVDFPED